MAVVSPPFDVEDRFRPHNARIEVFVDRAQAGEHAAVVALYGEHDLATCEAVRVALAPLYGAILVDLTRCWLIDATVLGTILDKADALDRLGYRLELHVTATSSPTTRLLEALNADALVAVKRIADEP